MRSFLFSAVASLSLVACGGADPAAACVDYIAAFDACVDAAFGTATGGATVPDTFCDAYDALSGAAAESATDYLNCLADAYNNGDCSSSTGFGGIDVTACVAVR